MHPLSPGHMILCLWFQINCSIIGGKNILRKTTELWEAIYVRARIH